MGSTTSKSWKTAAAALTLGAVLSLGLGACGKNKGKVYFGNLKDGAEVESPFTVEMKAENLIVEPAVNGVRDGHGHFHILVNTPIPMSLDPIPNDAQHIHYGQGESVTMLDLPVGEHTLILQFAKGDHRPYDPQISQEIKIRVTRQNTPAGTNDAMNDGSGAGYGEGNGTDGTGNGAGTSADSLKARANPDVEVTTPAVGGAVGGGMGGSGSMGAGGM